jgi:hypothetical protein
MNDWIKDPRLFYAAFDLSNKVQREALHGLIRSFAKEDTPEWAIRRAFFHARMHLSLISQEWHSYSGYGHANLTEDFQPTYTDPALKNLETYRTWWFGEQWQVGYICPEYGISSLPRIELGVIIHGFIRTVTDEGETYIDRCLMWVKWHFSAGIILILRLHRTSWSLIPLAGGVDNKDHGV